MRTSNSLANTVEIFDASTRSFRPGPPLGINRTGITNAFTYAGGAPLKDLLADGGMYGSARAVSGRIFVNAQAIKGGDVIDTSAGTSATTPGASVDRVFHTQTRLADGRVLIIGGFDDSGTPLASAELYDPATGTFAPTGSLSGPRALHTATLLADGRVLVVGGIGNKTGGATFLAAIYTPSTGTFSTKGILPSGLAGHTATLIQGCACALDGKVLIAGGFGGSLFGAQTLETSTSKAYIYDPATGLSSATTGALHNARMLHTATPLPNGKVVLIGGIQGQGLFAGKSVLPAFGGVKNSAEIFDPGLGTFACVGVKVAGACRPSMTNARAGHASAYIGQGPLAGQILVTGGFGSTTDTSRKGTELPLRSAELFNPATGRFVATKPMAAYHLFHGSAAVEN